MSWEDGAFLVVMATVARYHQEEALEVDLPSHREKKAGL